jgi:tRNA(Ile)-lysidine synthase
MSESLQQRVLRYIRAQQLIRAGERVAVAVSGGADSVALLRLLLELRAELGVVLSVLHLNHQLRGTESDADEAFVADMAKRYGLELFSRSVDVRGYAEEHKLSLEAVGRKLRYRTFADATAAQKLNAIATAHTRDDQLETVLFKFLRGAWTRGLAGIFPAQSLTSECGARVVRPLLLERRFELRSFLQAVGQPWREDASNEDRSFTRNRIRHELIPLLERDFNPAIAEVLSGTAEIARAEQEYWEQRSPELWASIASGANDTDIGFDAETFRTLTVAEQRRALTHGLRLLTGIALDFHHVEAARLAILNGGKASLPQGLDLNFGGRKLVLHRRERGNS